MASSREFQKEKKMNAKLIFLHVYVISFHPLLLTMCSFFIALWLIDLYQFLFCGFMRLTILMGRTLKNDKNIRDNQEFRTSIWIAIKLFFPYVLLLRNRELLVSNNSFKDHTFGSIYVRFGSTELENIWQTRAIFYPTFYCCKKLIQT